MTRRSPAPVARSFLAAALAAFLGSSVVPAAAPAVAIAATSGATGSLGAGGVAKGDISLDAGDVDTVSVDLVEGSTLTAKFTSTFAATVDFAAPDGTAIDLGWGAGNRRAAKPWKVLSTGRHTFRIASSTGAQGSYVLTALAKWPRKVSLSGTSGGTVSWGMPAGATISGKVAAFPARSWDPRVDSILGGGGDLLAAPIQGVKGQAKLPKLRAGADGLCAMTVSGGPADAAGGQFRAALVLAVPRTKPVQANLKNGLTVISFANDGVKSLLAEQCVACHTWAAGAATYKSHAKMAVVRVKNGTMPQGGRPLSAAQIGLLEGWIATGMKP